MPTEFTRFRELLRAFDSDAKIRLGVKITLRGRSSGSKNQNCEIWRGFRVGRAMGQNKKGNGYGRKYQGSEKQTQIRTLRL